VSDAHTLGSYFEDMTDLVLRKLFVGMTRARLKLVLVMSDRAAL
jgi:hypothetical protein